MNKKGQGVFEFVIGGALFIAVIWLFYVGINNCLECHENFSSVMTELAPRWCREQTYEDDVYLDCIDFNVTIKTDAQLNQYLVLLWSEEKENIENCSLKKELHNFTHGIWLEDEEEIRCMDDKYFIPHGETIKTGYTECVMGEGGCWSWREYKYFTLDEVLRRNTI